MATVTTSGAGGPDNPSRRLGNPLQAVSMSSSGLMVGPFRLDMVARHDRSRHLMKDPNGQLPVVDQTANSRQAPVKLRKTRASAATGWVSEQRQPEH